MSGYTTGIEGCASWAPASTRGSWLTSRSGGRRPMTAMEYYRDMSARPLEQRSRFGPAIFKQARAGGDGSLPPCSPDPGVAASRVTPSFVHEREETERLSACAPAAPGFSGERVVRW